MTNPIVNDNRGARGDLEGSVELKNRKRVGGGRLGVYTALAAAAGTVPLPWLPDAIGRRVRGALAQDIAARHGLSLSNEARALLSEPEARERARGIVGQAVKFATTKLLTRITPFGFLPPLRAGTQAFALGHLLDRYLMTARDERALRIDAEEARRIRDAIDAAIVHVMRGGLDVDEGARFAPPEDLRDQTTQFVDGLFIAAASLPDWLVRRLDAAFDVCIQGHVR